MRPTRGLLALVLLTGCVLLVFVSDHDVLGTQHTTTLTSTKVFNARTPVTLTGASGSTSFYILAWVQGSLLYPSATWPVADKEGFVTNVLIGLERCLGSGESIQFEIAEPDAHELYLGPFVLAQGDNSLAVNLGSGHSFKVEALPDVRILVTWSGLSATTIVTSTLHGFDL